MSTRCNVIVKDGKEVSQYYHHFDGYLSGVGNELFESVQKGFYDGLGHYGGYEPEDHGLHGDIEYLYYVDLDNKKVYYNRIGHTPIKGKNFDWEESLEKLAKMPVSHFVKNTSELFIEMTEIAND